MVQTLRKLLAAIAAVRVKLGEVRASYRDPEVTTKPMVPHMTLELAW